jgi:hypothetical protein
MKFANAITCVRRSGGSVVEALLFTHAGSNTNESTALPFVIPSAAEGSAVSESFLEMFFGDR